MDFLADYVALLANSKGCQKGHSNTATAVVVSAVVLPPPAAAAAVAGVVVIVAATSIAGTATGISHHLLLGMETRNPVSCSLKTGHLSYPVSARTSDHSLHFVNNNTDGWAAVGEVRVSDINNLSLERS